MTNSQIINISGYRFIPLEDPNALKADLLASLPDTGVKGVVLLAIEGVNITLAGTRKHINAALACFERHESLSNIWFKESYSDFVPHKRLRVRVRSEIIAFEDKLEAEQISAAPEVSPQVLDKWLDEKRPLTLLDARNDYEIESGTFEQAVHLNIKHFRHFRQAVERALEDGTLNKSQPVVTFCTGGIRCQKAAPWLISHGFEEVYQVQGGVIHYLEESEAEHWQGQCFVFDQRVELNRDLQPTGAGLCDVCQLAVKEGAQCQCQLGVHYHATYELDK